MNGFIDRYRPWFALRDIPGLGSTLFKRLVDAFGTPEKVFTAPEEALRAVKGMRRDALAGILKGMDGYGSEELKEILRRGFKIVTLNCRAYPPLLKHIPDPPPLLVYLGEMDPEAPCIAIVGSRKATGYGRATAEKLSAGLAQCGCRVVSGMALGIDTAAHQGALSVKQGRTVAVLGSGLTRIYPRQNRSLYYRIADHGAVISELGIFHPPDARHFPMRNRIIAGMSAGTLVVEAAARSGSLITARQAADYGREVFAVPGSIHSHASSGTHALLKQGAALVETARDILDQLGHFVHPADSGHERPGQVRPQAQDITRSVSGSRRCGAAGVSGTPRQKVLDCLESYPVHLDILIRQSGLDAATVSALLLELELEGIVRQSPGNFFIISEEST